jgi:hypothetical protein
MSKFCPLNTKIKRKNFVGMKTSDFILQGRKPKLTIKVGTESIFYYVNKTQMNIKKKSDFFKRKNSLEN